VGFFALDLGRFLTLDALKSSQAVLAAWFDTSPWLVAGAYLLIYVAVTALSLPGAVVMTLAGGAFFGLWTGLLLVSFASSIGATLAFLASRFLLRDWVQSRFGNRLAAINAGMAKDGAFYLFHAATGAGVSVLHHQFTDGFDPDQDAHLLLGQPARHAGRLGGVRERGHAVGATGKPVRHSVAGLDWFVCVAWAFSVAGEASDWVDTGAPGLRRLAKTGAFRAQSCGHRRRRRWSGLPLTLLPP
jgi:hypothetical protein